MIIIEKDNFYSFKKVERLMEPTPKALNECRGPVIADYQDHLEQEWVNEVRAKYKVEINTQVFESMIKK